MSKKESKIQNLQKTLNSLNKNKAELTKGGSSSVGPIHMTPKSDILQDPETSAHYHSIQPPKSLEAKEIHSSSQAEFISQKLNEER